MMPAPMMPNRVIASQQRQSYPPQRALSSTMHLYHASPSSSQRNASQVHGLDTLLNFAKLDPSMCMVGERARQSTEPKD